MLLVERIVLESLLRGKKSREEIFKETGLPLRFLDKILNAFKDERIIKVHHESYSLSKSSVLNKENIFYEIRDLFENMLSAFLDAKEDSNVQVRLRKFYLDANDKLYFGHHIRNLENFILEMEKKNRNRGVSFKLKEQTIFIQANAPYEMVLQKYLEIR